MNKAPSEEGLLPGVLKEEDLRSGEADEQIILLTCFQPGLGEPHLESPTTKNCYLERPSKIKKFLI